MDVLIYRFGRYEFSPYGKQKSETLGLNEYKLQSSSDSISHVQWISDLSEFAQSGTIQLAILIISVVILGFRLVRRRKSVLNFKPKAASIRWPYEVCSQAARATTVAFFALAFIQGRAHMLNVIVLGCSFVLGLLRLINDLQWRHIALHQINFINTSMLIVTYLGQFLSCVEQKSRCSRDSSIVGAMAFLVTTVVIAVITPREWTPPPQELEIPGFSDPDRKPSSEETCSWLNYYVTYEWLTPLLWKGTTGKLDKSGLPRLAWYDDPDYLLHKLLKSRSMSTKTIWTVLRFQKTELILMTTWVSLAYIIENVAPFAMFNLLAYLANPKGAEYKPWVWLALTFLGPLTRSVFFQQYIFTSTRLIVRIKSAMTQELYHKALESMELEEDPFEADPKKVTSSEDGKGAKSTTKTTSAGRLANLMAADVDAIYKTRDIVMAVFGIPVGTIVSVIGLYKMLGWTSLVGLVVLVLATPASVWLGKLMYTSQKRVRTAQDARISLVTEYLASIRAIKYFAWEDAITEKIVESRAVEQNELWRVAVINAIFNQVLQIIPYVSLLVIFALYVGVEQKRLEASVAFTTVFLIKNIRRNIMMVSFFFRAFAAAMVAFGRLDKYFESTVPTIKFPVGPLRIEDGYFRRNKKATFRLEEISIDFVEGGLNVITGQSGSGKSTLLLAILGETYVEGGRLTRPEDVAFASQSSWLQNDTIEANILFTSPMERVRYDRVVEACSLPVDFKEVSDGDQTVVGENGASLSGGQKARVALARALYSKAPLLLLDDIFSALDAKTAADVWKRCFCSDMLKDRTIVLVTQVPWISEQGDLSIVMEKGQMKSCEPNIGVVRKPVSIAGVLGGDADDEVTPPEPELQPSGDAMNDTTKVATAQSEGNDLVSQELKASGKVGRLTFIEYMSYFGNPFFTVLCLVVMLVSNVLFFLGTFWLSIWVEAYDQYVHPNIPFYMGIWALITILEILSYAVIALLFEWGGWRAGRKLHNDFIRAVMSVSLSWFKKTPVGRITNRFSSDIASIDTSLGGMVRWTLDAVIMLFFRLGAVSSIMPIFIIPAFFTCLIGIAVGEAYTRTAVVLKRLTSSAQSPVFSQFADTLAGLPVIRARAGMSKAFGDDLANKLRTWSAASEATYNCNRWVAVRVDFVTALVALSAGIIAVSQAGLVGAGLVGFSLTNANGLSQTILMLVRAMNDLEVEMQSFHRVKEYVKLEPEEKNDEVFPDEGEYVDDETAFVPKLWPRSGSIEFRDVTIRYDVDGPDILKNVNLKFRAGERVAVVGRTGSGKSTLVLSLLRFTHVVSGKILYDGVDITKVSRERLRKGLTIIPQEAVLFSGTVESNLDPSGRLPKAKLERALENCKGIASFAGEATEDGDESRNEEASRAQAITLSTEVDARGENFSHGQRQVLSLCRALIRQSKLMLLDEATASMDYETDRGIQQVLRDELEEEAGGGRTLVTIAHRLRTIIDYDSIVVMSAGTVCEFGSPKELYDAKGSFYDMVQHSGEVEELQEFLGNKTTATEETQS